MCPYYVSRSLRGPADIIFTPYNYLLDPKARKSYGIELGANVVIFDEAHNLEQFCEETSSFSISSYDISTALEAIDELINKLQNQVCDFVHSVRVFVSTLLYLAWTITLRQSCLPDSYT